MSYRNIITNSPGFTPHSCEVAGVASDNLPGLAGRHVARVPRGLEGGRSVKLSTDTGSGLPDGPHRSPLQSDGSVGRQAL